MNKNILALVAAFSGAVSAAQVYSDDASTLNIGGRIEARGNGVVGHDNFNDDSRVRVNIAGQTQINDDYTALVSLNVNSNQTKAMTKTVTSTLISVAKLTVN